MITYVIQATAVNKEGKERLAFGYSNPEPSVCYDCFLAWVSRNAVDGWEYYPFMEKLIITN